MTCFDHESLVGLAIESVLAQTWSDWELLVADDGSRDGSAKVIREMAGRDDRIHPRLHADNQGKSRRMNDLLAEASGEMIAFLDSDDAWLPNKLAAQVELLDDRPEVDVVHGDGVIEDRRPAERRKHDPAWPRAEIDGTLFTAIHRPSAVRSGELLHELLAGNFIFYSSMTGRTEVMRGAAFDANVRRSLDWLYVVDVAATGARFAYMPEPLAIYRVHGANVQNDAYGTIREMEARRLVLDRYGDRMSPAARAAHLLALGRTYLRLGDVEASRDHLRMSLRYERRPRALLLYALALMGGLRGMDWLPSLAFRARSVGRRA
jgi:glycosyltransferase involved in cell wall biosynthesis